MLSFEWRGRDIYINWVTTASIMAAVLCLVLMVQAMPPDTKEWTETVALAEDVSVCGKWNPVGLEVKIPQAGRWRVTATVNAAVNPEQEEHSSVSCRIVNTINGEHASEVPDTRTVIANSPESGREVQGTVHVSAVFVTTGPVTCEVQARCNRKHASSRIIAKGTRFTVTMVD